MFTKKKFLKLDLFQQHKKCAEILRFIYLQAIKKKDYISLITFYNQMISWLNIDIIKTNNIKDLSDRYHFHLKKAHLSLKEHNLLPSIIRKKDKEVPKEDFLDNAIYLDEIRSAYNVGNILRTAEALRIGKVYFSPNTPYIQHNKVQKTSMGAFSYVPCFPNSDISSLPRPIIAIDTSDSANSIFDFTFPKTSPFTIILGNEEYGISEKSLSYADYIIEIKMSGIKNSINVAAAFAIVAAEIKRQTNKETGFF